MHHVTRWADGGHTDVDEMVLLRRTHHSTVHEGGWSIQRLAPGKFTFIDPNGVIHPAAWHTTTSTIITQILHTHHDQPRAGPNTDAV